MADMYPNLPGVVLDLKDGNLSIFPEDTTPRVLILGVSGSGSTELSRVTRNQLAENEYGLAGTLLQGMLEARQGGATNIYLKRLGATPAKITGIGDTTGAAGITVQTVLGGAESGEDVKIFWDDSETILKMWDQNDNPIYDSTLNLNSGAVIVSGTAVGGAGADIGTSTVPVLMSEVVTAGTAYTAGQDGLNPTKMELYEYLDKAYNELEAAAVDYVVPMGCYEDDFNLADDQAIITTVDHESLGNGDGVKTTFSLAHSRVVPSTVVVEVNNVATTAYTFSAGTGTLGVDQIIITALPTVITDEAVGNGDGNEDTFDLAHKNVVAATLVVEVDGNPVTAYTLSVGTGTLGVDQIIFDTPPGLGLAITATYTYTHPVETGIGVAVSYSYVTKDALLYFRKWEEDGSWKYEWHTAKTRTVGQTTYSYHEVNFAHQLAMFCHNLSTNDNFALGCIGMRMPISGLPSDISNWLGKAPVLDINGTVLTNGSGLLGNKFMTGTTAMAPGFWYSDSGYLDDATNKSVAVTPDIGKYLSIVVTPVTFYNSIDSTGYGYMAPGHALYAGFIAMLPVNQAPTNKVLRGVALPYNLTKAKADALSGTHYVSFGTRDRGVTIMDGPTAATSASDYQRLSTIRIVMQYVDRARAILNPYLGNSSSGTTRAAMQTAIEELGNKMVEEGALQAQRPLISATAQQQVLGQATLEVVLVPAFELRKIQMVIGLSAT